MRLKPTTSLCRHCPLAISLDCIQAQRLLSGIRRCTTIQRPQKTRQFVSQDAPTEACFSRRRVIPEKTTTTPRLPVVLDDHSGEYHDGRRLRHRHSATRRPRVDIRGRPRRGGFILDVFYASDGMGVVVIVGLRGPTSPTFPRRRVQERVLVGKD